MKTTGSLLTKLTFTATSCLLLVGALSCDQPKETSDTVEVSIPDQITNLETVIDYQSCGSGDLTLLLVHGWCIDQTYWSYQQDGFCSDYRIVTIDLPGFGRSGKNRTDWSIEQYGKDIKAVIEQLQLKNVVLVGHSMGGDIILEAALNNQEVIALVGIDNFKEVGLKFDTQLKQEIDGFLEVLAHNFTEVSSAYAEGALFHPTTDSMVINRVVNSIVSSDSIVAVETIRGLFDYTTNESRKLKQLNKKMYLINSSNTPTDTVALAKTGVAFDLHEIAGTGHYPMIEKPGEFNKKLRLVLDDIEGSLLVP